jgi:hypothetical protein
MLPQEYEIVALIVLEYPREKINPKTKILRVVRLTKKLEEIYPVRLAVAKPADDRLFFLRCKDFSIAPQPRVLQAPQKSASF